jgi:hypothetical protein
VEDIHMSAAQVIRIARAAGIELILDGTGLLIGAASEPAPSVIEELRRYKPEIVELLRSDCDRRRQRAAFLELEAGLPRAKAEAIASLEHAGYRVCAQCGAVDDSRVYDYGGTLLHEECYRFWGPATALPRNDPDLLASNQPGTYEQAVAELHVQCPQLVEADRWQRAIHDTDAFLAAWGARARALGWTASNLFGLHAVPERPAAIYRRLSRYDETGLIWLLHGRPIIALTETEAAIRSAGAVVMYRKPVLRALGNSLDTWSRGPHPRSPHWSLRGLGNE